VSFDETAPCPHSIF
jgi:hypothetical protein